MDKITFVVWTRFDRRSELLAERLGATMHFVYYGQRGKLLQSPIRYLVQALQTWRILRQDQPNIVFVQNPPIFAVLVAFLYHQRYKAQYVIDSHTSAFLSPKWRWSLGLHRLLAGFALTTIVHNESQEEIVKCWGCRYCVVADPVGGYPAGEHYSLDGQFNVAVISTFEEDEPLDVVFEAANRLPDFDFYVTGDVNCAAPGVLAKRPDNCHLTGFLPYDRYIGLLRAVDVILDLTTRDHTLLCGAFEAVSLGKPLIVSDWPILRDHFPLGTLHIPNTVEGVCHGMRQAQAEHDALQRDILRLRDLLEKEWKQKLQELRDLLRSHLKISSR